jgi:hypothetical protein
MMVILFTVDNPYAKMLIYHEDNPKIISFGP